MTEEEKKERRREISRRWREANPEKAKEAKRRYREANRSEPRVALSEQERKARRREYNRKYREANQEILTDRSRQHYAANRENIRDQQRQYYVENKENIYNSHIQWRNNNRERVRESNRHHGHIRRAQKANATDPCRPVTMAIITRRVLLFGNSCAYCGASSPSHIDHVEPLARGGFHVPDNLVPACQRCNCSKSDSSLGAWYPSQPFFSHKRWEALQTHTGRRWSDAEQLSLMDLLPT